MKRTEIVRALVSCLLFWQLSGPILAQEATQKQPPAKWAHAVEGVDVLRLWGTDLGPDMPQIAILRLSEGMYGEFQKAPKDFLEKHEIFPVKLQTVDHHRVRTPKKKSGPARDPLQVVVCTHNKYSNSVCASAESL